MCGDKWILTLGVLAIGILGPAEAYTNQWAAHIDGGPRIARQVARDHGFRYRREVIGRLCSLPTIAWTHAKYPSASVINSRTVRHCDMARQNSLKQSTAVGSFGASPAPIGSSMLSPFARKIGPCFHHNLSSLLDSTTKASLNRQSPEPSSIPILFPSRPFSHLSNRGIKVSDGILGDRFKRLQSSDSHGNDRQEEKKAKARGRDRRAIDKLNKNRKEPDKPLEVSKDSCKPKTQACPKECTTTSASSSSATEPKKEPQGISCSDSQKPSNLATTGHHPSKLLKTSEHIKADDPPNKDTELSTKSLLSTNIKSHGSPMSYVDKMQECSAPRLRKRKNRSRGNIREHKVPDDRGLSSTDEPRKWKPTFLTSRQMIIGDWHHLEHRSVKKRSTEPHLEVHRRLTGDSRVRRAEQQRAKSRPKRDLVVKRPPSMQMIFNDRRWAEMWYLNRGNGLDMNVQEAWAEGITGKGIVVTILDDGLEKDHPDLLKNYDPEASYDVNGYDDDPMPRYDIVDSNRHGTRCAGEVAATPNNSMCSVGVSYGASVGGVRMLDGDVTDAVEAKSLSLYPHHIDIYSASWGPDDDGKTVDGPGELATRAFNEGVTKGRKGKGSIFVWASGNGGRDHDNCNCDGYTNSIWTLSISSATENGLVPWYSEACSSTLATTYSSGSVGEKQVVTTDLHHQCTSSHTGTSASAPLAAGICALALEANPELTWRDMQHIVVRTARPANLKAPDWVTNGVGRNVSHSFGYGLMDAAAMVRLSRKWRTVPEQQKCEVSAPHSGRYTQIPPRSQLILELHVKECTGVNFLEHVQAKVSLMASRRGDLQIQLTSPQGTKSTLLAKRPHDISKAGFNQWPFMSVHTWGERPHGTWKLEIHNEGRYLGRATLHEWALIFYGTSTLPDRTEYALYSPAGASPPRRPFVKTRESAAPSKNALLTSSYAGPKAKTSQHSKSAKIHAGGIGYPLNASSPSAKKAKARGQHKNGKSANRGGSSRPTVQTLRGLTSGRAGSADSRGNLPTVKSRPRSTPSPGRQSTTRSSLATTTTTRTTRTTTKTMSISENPTVAPFQRALILMEPPPPKASTNRVPVVFLQYPKIQQLYPLYPVYGGARGAGPEHPAGSGVKGLDLLQDQQFDTRNLQLPDKGTLEEWNMVFYGTDKSLEIDEELDKDKEFSRPLAEVPEVVNENKAPAYSSQPKVVDSDGIPWTGSQKVDQISHPEVQKPTTENQTSGGAGACIRSDTRGCLECDSSWYLYEGRCVAQCPARTYPAQDDRKKVCSMCHYTCASCDGVSNADCTSCHADATLVSTYKGDSQCVQKSLEWKFHTTLWFYRMSIIFGINLGLLVAGAIYLCLTFMKKRDKASGHCDYNKLLSPEDDDEAAIGETKRNQLLHRNGCLSDSD